MTYTEKLREEWDKYSCIDDSFESFDIRCNAGRIADFFLSKHNTLLDEINTKLVEKKKDLPVSIDLEIDAVTAANAIRNQGYNQALEDLLEFIETKR